MIRDRNQGEKTTRVTATNMPDHLGRYRIVRELGRGEMGVVYEGLDPNIERRVAIKTVRRDKIESSPNADEMMKRFLREARAAGALNHPNIIIIHDADEANGIGYIVMEFLEGGDLRKVIEEKRHVDPETVAEMGAAICEALASAHDRGVIHRDIKPANIMTPPGGPIKVADFGIAHMSDSTLTQEGALIGTPFYMSPEQCMGQEVDGRSDLFSVAVMLYELLTREKPFTGEVLTTVMYHVINANPAPPHELNVNVPEALSRVILKALSKRPVDRYLDGRAMAAALRESLKPQPNPLMLGFEKPAPVPGATKPGPPPPGVEAPPMAVAPGRTRFTVSAEGVIFDSETGLEWLVGPDQDTDYDQAEQWVASCKVGGGGWRMPNLQELRGLYQPGAGMRNMDPVFKTGGWWVWAEPCDSSSASDFRFHNGDEYWINRDDSSDNRVFAVRSRPKQAQTVVPGNGEQLALEERPLAADKKTRFTVSAEGVIADSQTDLEWLVGPDQDTDYNQAEQWVASCKVAGGGWRMPNRKELRGLYQPGVGRRNMDPAFTTEGWWVWAESRDPSSAWYFLFNNGNEDWDYRNGLRYHRVFAVRSRSEQAQTVAPGNGEQLALEEKPLAADKKTRFTVSAEGVIFDAQTGLEWLVGPDRDTTYEEAEQWVASCKMAGGGWRMPNREELRGLYQPGVGRRNMDPVFNTTGWWVWAESRDSSSAWRFGFRNGGEDWADRDYSGNGRVFAVRSRSRR